MVSALLKTAFKQHSFVISKHVCPCLSQQKAASLLSVVKTEIDLWARATKEPVHLSQEAIDAAIDKGHPIPVVKIDNRADNFATVVTIEFGDQLGELLDTVRHSCSSIGDLCSAETCEITQCGAILILRLRVGALMGEAYIYMYIRPVSLLSKHISTFPL